MTGDMSGAFMQAHIDEAVKVEGGIAELLKNIEPKLYSRYAVIETDKKVIYDELRKELHYRGGMTRAILTHTEVSRVFQAKRCGRVETRDCADGIQCIWKSNAVTSSPIVCNSHCFYR